MNCLNFIICLGIISIVSFDIGFPILLFLHWNNVNVPLVLNFIFLLSLIASVIKLNISFISFLASIEIFMLIFYFLILL